MKHHRFLPLIPLLFAVLLGCSLDYADAIVEEDLSETVPDTVLFDIVHSVVRGGVVVVTLEADRGESYGAKHETSLYGVRFREYDGQGELITEGQAEQASYRSDTENAEMSGSISFRSIGEGVKFQAEYLYWEMENRRLTSRPEELVTIERDNGTFIEGKGFEADFQRKVIRLRDFRGRYVQEE